MQVVHLEACQGERTQKLIADLTPKQYYGTDLRILQFALEQGYMATRVHRILLYIQEEWMADYIVFNTAESATAA